MPAGCQHQNVSGSRFCQSCPKREDVAGAAIEGQRRPGQAWPSAAKRFDRRIKGAAATKRIADMPVSAPEKRSSNAADGRGRFSSPNMRKIGGSSIIRWPS